MIRFPIAMLVRLELQCITSPTHGEIPENSPGKQSSRPVEPTMGHVQSCSLRVFFKGHEKDKAKKNEEIQRCGHKC